jgi:hypothetical protein
VDDIQGMKHSRGSILHRVRAAKRSLPKLKAGDAAALIDSEKERELQTEQDTLGETAWSVNQLYECIRERAQQRGPHR